MLAPVAVTSDGIIFQQYPFAPASIYPQGMVRWEQVREIVPTGFPPEIRTVAGEVLFVPAGQKDTLIAAARQYGIPRVERVDVWSLLLEPFLDTEFDAATQARVDTILAENAIPAHERIAIRQRFAKLMYAYNFGTGLWEWVHLGLYDLLAAHCLLRAGTTLSRINFTTVYWEAMRIAERANIRSIPPETQSP